MVRRIHPVELVAPLHAVLLLRDDGARDAHARRDEDLVVALVARRLAPPCVRLPALPAATAAASVDLGHPRHIAYVRELPIRGGDEGRVRSAVPILEGVEVTADEDCVDTLCLQQLGRARHHERRRLPACVGAARGKIVIALVVKVAGEQADALTAVLVHEGAHEARALVVGAAECRLGAHPWPIGRWRQPQGVRVHQIEARAPPHDPVAISRLPIRRTTLGRGLPRGRITRQDEDTPLMTHVGLDIRSLRRARLLKRDQVSRERTQR
mmetsp:Transcript_513/g.1329  ORF Transcript_513/g.1329 Transcript_513/m.1329 type:complete len:268 (-) Transcript_513:409-1212(-)